MSDFVQTNKYVIYLLGRNVKSTLTFEPAGRLGNLMFEYASLLGIAHANNRKPVLPQSQHGQTVQECFKLLSAKLDPNPGPIVTHRPADLHFSFDAFQLSSNVTTLKGQLQSWKYFRHLHSTIIKEFTFKRKLQENAKETLKNISALTGRGDLTFVGVQVRRGDFVHTYSSLINAVTPYYLRTAMDLYRSRHQKVFFVVTTDDVTWCKDNIISRNDVYLSLNQTACEDLALLASCKHSIISAGSSFGWWGAYLAGGNTTYYKGWLKHNAWHNLEFVEEDYYPPEWTELPRL